jgi:hypothetical protein
VQTKKKKVCETPSPEKSWAWWLISVIPAAAGSDPISKIARAKRAGGMVQAIE